MRAHSCPHTASPWSPLTSPTQPLLRAARGRSLHAAPTYLGSHGGTSAIDLMGVRLGSTLTPEMFAAALFQKRGEEPEAL